MSFLRADQDYRQHGGLYTVSTQDPELFHQFQAFQVARPQNPMSFDIPERQFLRGKLHCFQRT